MVCRTLEVDRTNALVLKAQIGSIFKDGSYKAVVYWGPSCAPFLEGFEATTMKEAYENLLQASNELLGNLMDRRMLEGVGDQRAVRQLEGDGCYDSDPKDYVLPPPRIS